MHQGKIFSFPWPYARFNSLPVNFRGIQCSSEPASTCFPVNASGFSGSVLSFLCKVLHVEYLEAFSDGGMFPRKLRGNSFFL